MSFKRIFSKTSFKSYPSSRNGQKFEEICQLNHEIEVLKQTVYSLKISLERKDAAIGNLAREKEKLFVELKGAKRITRELRQQILDQQEIHSKYKEHLNQEIERPRTEEPKVSSTCFTKEQMLENMQFKLLEKDKIIYSVCARYLHLKNSKISLRKRLQRLYNDTQETYERLILILHENRLTIDKMLDNILKFSTVSRESKSYLQVLRLIKTNVKLNYENTQLKIALLRSDNLTEKSDTERNDNHGFDHCEQELSRSIQKEMSMINTDHKYSSKSLRELLKYKLNSNEGLNPALTNLYKTTNTSSSQGYTLKKSISLPILMNYGSS